MAGVSLALDYPEHRSPCLPRAGIKTVCHHTRPWFQIFSLSCAPPVFLCVVLASDPPASQVVGLKAPATTAWARSSVLFLLCACVSHAWHMEVRRQLAGVGFLLSPWKSCVSMDFPAGTVRLRLVFLALQPVLFSRVPAGVDGSVAAMG